MNNFLAPLTILLKKELLQERRSFTTLGTLFFLNLTLSILFSLGFELAGLSPSQRIELAPTVIWLVFLLSASVAVSNAYEAEQKYRGIDALYFTGVSPWILYLAKTISSTTFLFCSGALATVSLFILLNLEFWQHLPAFLGLGLLVSGGFSALAALINPLSASSRAKGIIFPCLLLPLVFPLLFAALQLSYEIISQSFNWQSSWLTLLIGLDLVYIVLGINLYEHTIRE